MILRIMNKLAVLIPSYNEESNLIKTLSVTQNKIDELVLKNLISEDSFVAFIDDGSIDNTWLVIKDLKKKFPKLKALKLSRNCGHQIALFAGINEFKNACDFSISIDADMQHDINKFEDLINSFHKNFDIVIAISDRKLDSFFKKITAKIFYKFINFISVSRIEPHHADFRLLSQQAMYEISKYENKNIFLRGLISTLNFNIKTITYNLKERTIGKSKYSFTKMLQLALDGVTSQSTYPLRLSAILGIFIIIFCFFSFILVLIDYFIFKNTVPGWASTIIPIYFLGGVQIFFLGIIGEYISKIYNEVSKSPTYSVLKKIE